MDTRIHVCKICKMQYLNAELGRYISDDICPDCIDNPPIKTLLELLHLKLDTLTRYFAEEKDTKQFLNMLHIFKEDTVSAVDIISELVK